ncbi:MAG: exodeoxyribonuclease III [Salibacteraceae bacterium]
MKLISWNVNGIRATYKKGFAERLEEMQPDVICLQETKAQDDQVAETLFDIGYNVYSNSAEKKGYSGTAILSKDEPMNILPDLGVKEHDAEGRVLVAEYPGFYLLTVYTPNSGQGLKRHGYRKSWDEAFLEYVKSLESKKPVMICGDLNVAHKPIDLKNDKSNYNKTAGYTQLEIDGMDSIIQAGYVDTFRHFYPNEEKYSWWSFRSNAREKNIGWRLDYFLSSPKIIDKVKDAFILNEIHGSDHCPVGVELTL